MRSRLTELWRQESCQPASVPPTVHVLPAMQRRILYAIARATATARRRGMGTATSQHEAWRTFTDVPTLNLGRTCTKTQERA